VAKRDPNNTARNRIIAAIKVQLRELLEDVLEDTGFDTEASLNATIGSKHDEFFDLKHDVIPNHEAFMMKWLEGLKKASIHDGGSSLQMWKWLKKYPSFKEYLLLFLKRSYLKRYDELSKNRPDVSDSILWIGQENANYGLLVTPRFVDGQWENDKSEIRAFPKPYFTIGHVLETGLVIPGKNKRFKFGDIDQYLLFFSHTLVRASGSPYELELAEHYCEFVTSQAEPENVPLLIPEYRYGGLAKKHEYRLDLLVINPYTMDKIGFELSPWSTHGYLKKIGGLTQAKINEMAKDNFEKEMTKHRLFFKKRNIYCLIYTDKMLKDTEKLFDEEIAPLLIPEDTQTRIDFRIMEEFLEE
jgi:hypothetical protein